MTNTEIRDIAMKQLAADCNCEAVDFLNAESKVVPAKLLEGRRRFITKPSFCHFTCFGNATVAVVDVTIESYIEAFIGNKLGFRCFDMPHLSTMNAELIKYGQCIGEIEEFYLPDLAKERNTRADFDIKLFENDEIYALYEDDRFKMALSYEEGAEYRDVLAVAGYQDKQITGVACAMNDSDTIWQIGIDVIPGHRRKGVASILTSVLTNEILRRNKVPYYGTAWSNIASKNVAIKSGYRPAWVELNVIALEESLKFTGEY